MKPNVVQGTYYLFISTVIYVLSGYLMQIGLGRILGPADYGLFVVVLYLVNIAGLLLTTGIPQAVSKFISENEENADVVAFSALKLQSALSFVVFLIFFMSADSIAHLLNDEKLTIYIQVSAFAIPTYAIYSIFALYLNGKRKYKEQAHATISYSIVRVVLPIGLALIGFSIFGAIIGQILAPLAGFYIFLRYPFWKNSPVFEIRRILNFAAPVVLFSIAINIFLSLDLFFVKSFLSNADMTGYYSAVATISKAPYFAIGALAGALYPAISSSSSGGYLERTRTYAYESFRYSLMFLLPMALIISATSDGLVELLYSKTYLPAGEPLSMLVIGILFFALFSLFTTIMIGCGHPGAAMVISLITLTLDFIINSKLVPLYGMLGAATATTISSVFGFFCAYYYANRLLGSLASFKSIFRIIFSSLFVYYASIVMGLSGTALIAGYLALTVIYISLLFLSNELKKEDTIRVKEMLML